MPGHYESGLTEAVAPREPIDYMGECGDRAYVTARLGEQGVAIVLNARMKQCDHVLTSTSVQVEQPMLPIEVNQ